MRTRLAALGLALAALALTAPARPPAAARPPGEFGVVLEPGPPAGTPPPDSSWRTVPLPATADSVARTRLQVSTAIAEGAKGIVFQGGRSAAIDSALAPLLAELRALGPALLPLRSLGVLRQTAPGEAGPGSPRLAVPDACRYVIVDLEGGGGDGMVGVFRDPVSGNPHLWIVNTSLESSASFRVKLYGIALAVQRISATSGAADAVARRVNAFDVPPLAPGEGALYRILR